MSLNTTKADSPPAEERQEGEDLFGFEISEELVRSPSHERATTVSVDFEGLLQSPLRVSVDLSGGCGGRIWEAGNVLARYLIRTKRDELGRSTSILELGAGGGLVGLAVAAGCLPKDSIVHITDQLPMLSLMRANIALNGLQERVEASIYDWGEPQPTGLPAHPQTILAADCVYFEPAFPLLLKTLHDLIGPGTTCYFCFKRRRRADLHFIKALKRQFEVVAAEDDPDQPVYARQNIFVYTIRQKTTPPLKI